jgi:Ferric reductase like transmembrane component
MTTLAAAGINGKALWYLTRGTGAVALLLLTAGLVLGVLSSVRWHARRLPRFLVSGLHRNLTLLALVFVAVHVVTTVADRFAPVGYKDAILPFLSPYRPLWLGLGTVAFDLLLALVATSLLRARIGLRAWRTVHWLAYASWPVALVHALGTGSDARAGWLGLLAIACTAAVAASVLWRAGITRGRPAPVRIATALSAVLVPLAILLWARGGPLRPGWASRAGTPKSLLASSRIALVRTASTAARPTAATTGPASGLPSGSFRAGFRGRLRRLGSGSNLVTVVIDGTATGGFAGRVHVALRGIPIAAGGVQMLASSVGLLPNGAGVWSAGHVVALAGQQILAEVRGSGGHPMRVLLSLRIDSSSGRISGVISGGSRGLGSGEGASTE